MIDCERAQRPAVRVSQSMMVWSKLAAASVRPSGEMRRTRRGGRASQRTQQLAARHVQSLTVLSLLPERAYDRPVKT